jgi:hypothetical protein
MKEEKKVRSFNSVQTRELISHPLFIQKVIITHYRCISDEGQKQIDNRFSWFVNPMVIINDNLLNKRIKNELKKHGR